MCLFLLSLKENAVVAYYVSPLILLYRKKRTPCLLRWVGWALTSSRVGHARQILATNRLQLLALAIGVARVLKKRTVSEGRDHASEVCVMLDGDRRLNCKRRNAVILDGIRRFVLRSCSELIRDELAVIRELSLRILV